MSDKFFDTYTNVKKEESFDQYLNLSPGPGENSPGVNNTSNYFNKQSNLNPSYKANEIHQAALSRQVPGLKVDYDLQKASSQTDLSEIPDVSTEQTLQQTTEQDISLFLDDLNSFHSPSDQLSQQLQFNGFGLDHQIKSSNNNSPVVFESPNRDSSSTPQSANLPPPVIISTPPPEDQYVNTTQPQFQQYQQFNQYPQQQQQQQQPQQQQTLQQQQSQPSIQAQQNFDQFQFTEALPQSQQFNSQDFLNTDFNANSFQQSRNNNGPLSDLSSVDNSPYLSAYSPSGFDDDILSTGYNDLIQPGEYDDIGQNLNSVNLDEGIQRPLTQENLLAANNGPQVLSPVTINIELTADNEVQKTPSLFSSNKSSPNNSPYHSRANSNSSERKSGYYSNLLSPHDQNSSAIDGEDESDDGTSLHANMRVGRQRRQSSRSRSNSQNRAVSRERSLSSNRDKMLELASPNQSNKRVQKHPSIYACHLCSKRFTRPYNLKSHLRTHTDERPFVCTVCGKAFARQHDRKRHEDLHSGKKRYECRGFLRDGVSQWGCGKRFARTDALGRHFKTEAGKECIRPLIEEHEREKASRSQKKKDNDTLGVPQVSNGGASGGNSNNEQFPDVLYEQFPSLLYGSQNNSGVSDNDNDE